MLHNHTIDANSYDFIAEMKKKKNGKVRCNFATKNIYYMISIIYLFKIILQYVYLLSTDIKKFLSIFIIFFFEERK